TIDARYRFYAQTTQHTNDIIILNISEEAIKRFEPFYGRWPWPRSLHGEVVEYLTSDGVAAIGFDIIFSEQSLRQEVDAATIQDLKALAKNSDIREVRDELLYRLEALRPEVSDMLFVSAVKNSGKVFQSSVFYANDNDLAEDPNLRANKAVTKKILSALSKSGLPIPGKRRQNVFFNVTVPFPTLAKASRGVGHINILPDGDGTYRRFVPLLRFKNAAIAYPALSLIIAAEIKGVPLHTIKVQDDSIILGDAVIPLLSDGSVMIHYQGGTVVNDKDGKPRFESFYRYIPYDYVIASKDLIQAGKQPLLSPGTFKDKIVLVTAYAAGISDFRATPFSPVTPGIEIHANIIDNVLSQKFLRQVDGWNEKVYVSLLAIVIGIIAAVSRSSIGFAVTLTFMGATVGLHGKLFGYGWVLPVVNTSVAMVGTYLGVLLLKYIFEEKEKRRIRFAFGHYLAPQVLEAVLRSPDKLKLGGERRYMTVLFSDVEGFTALSEQMQPEEISAILNEYLGQMMHCIKKTGGTLDKFIGDAVMAEWNAPVSQDDHAARACKTALFMMEELEILRAKWKKEQRPPLNARIGINSGDMVVGNMGSREIFDYTVIGTEVNTSARLEPLNKDFGTRIAVSDSTRREAEKYYPDTFLFRFLAKVALKGRNIPLNVYELVGWKDAIGKDHLEAMEIYREGLDLFFKARFSDARKLFQKAIERRPEDSPSETYVSLCAFYETNPPPSDWEGVYVQTSK
ncbi:MAG TPA: adenylate/guanylate cyclase domain-containing protein, partial [Candidatus Brocadiaceae bacterium]|nr:adenylate/guanylate cyclase domain-containing protein [Candidatus Brocadiaceae bacterium]